MQWPHHPLTASPVLSIGIREVSQKRDDVKAWTRGLFPIARSTADPFLGRRHRFANLAKP